MRDQESIGPGDRVRVSKVFDVDEIWYSDLTGNYGVVADSGHRYGTRNWKIEKVNKEEIMAEFKEEKITGYSQLKKGDRVRITREFEVTASDMWDGVKSKDNRKYRIAAAERGGMPGFEVVKLTRLEPESWPPQLKDVWATTSEEYHIIRNSYSHTTFAAYPSDNYNASPISIEMLKKLNPVLKYRSKGNPVKSSY